MVPPVLAMKEKMPQAGETIQVFVPDEELNKRGLTNEDAAILGVGSVGMTILLLFGGKIATTALLVSVMAVGSGAILWIKMPEKIEKIPLVGRFVKMLPISREKKKWILELDWKKKADDYELLIDILVSAGVVLIFGTTVTGLLAAGMTGLLVSSIFRIRKVARRVSFQVKEGFKEALH